MMKTRRGYSLIELLTVIAIIGILAAVLIIGATSYQKSQALSLSAENIKSQINQAYSLSLAPSAGVFGYGVYCESSQCLVYKNTQDNINQYDKNKSTAIGSPTTFQVGVSNANTSASDIYFTTPQASPTGQPYNPYYRATFFNGANLAANSDNTNSITLKDASGKTKILNINMVTNYVEIK